MSSKNRIWGLSVLALLAFGCSKSSDQKASDPAPAAAPVAANVPTADAKAVVACFLEAFRKGDNDAATKLLTKVARQKVEAKGLNVTPAANDQAKYEVEEVTYPTADHDLAHVPTKWIYADEIGRSRTDKAIWVCRLEPEGWRVAGFAAYVFEGEDPLLLSFEDPEEMAKKQKWLIEEFNRRAKEEASPSAAGANPLQAEKKPEDAFRR